MPLDWRCPGTHKVLSRIVVKGKVQYLIHSKPKSAIINKIKLDNKNIECID
jgi:hypothetical protein